MISKEYDLMSGAHLAGWWEFLPTLPPM